MFARAPAAGQAKTRLIPALGPRAAASFQAALISDALRKVAGLRGRTGRYLFMAGDLTRRGSSRTPAIVSEPDWQERGRILQFSTLQQRGKDLGQRLENAFRALFRTHQSCVLIGTDSPLFPARILRHALRELKVCDSVLGPCPDGGYYLIGLRRPADPRTVRGIFQKVRWSTAFAFRDTLRNLLHRGLSCSLLEACDDVDLPADLQRLKRTLSRKRKVRRLAPATWSFLKGIPVLSTSQGRTAFGPT